MRQSALFCLSEFFVFVLVNMWKNSHSLVASCFGTPRFVTPAAQTLQCMDQVVKNKQEKEHFQVSFRPITEQRDRCCRESCTWKDSECLYSPCWFLPEFNNVFFFFFFVFHRIWVSVRVFIDARRETWHAVRWGTARWREKKSVRGKGWKSYWTCTLMGEQIPSKLAASRREFDAALDASQPREAVRGDEKRDKGVRRRADTDRRGRGEGSERIKRRTCHVYIVSCFFLTVYPTPFSRFQISLPCDSLSSPPHLHIALLWLSCVCAVLQVRSLEPGCCTTVQWDTVQ